MSQADQGESGFGKKDLSGGFGKELGHQPISILAGAVEAVGISNRETAGQTRAGVWTLADNAMRLVNFSRVTASDIQNGLTTRALIAPVETIDPSLKPKSLMDTIGAILSGKGSNPDSQYGPWRKGDRAFCFSLRTATQDGRQGQVRGIAILEPDQFNSLYQELFQDPTTFFRVIETINKGPLQHPDGNPVNIIPGKGIFLLPNKELGGKLTSPQLFKFPDDINPNR